MNILYIGDVMGEPGIRVVEKMLPELRKVHALDLVIAQAERACKKPAWIFAPAATTFCTGRRFTGC
jgi:calcineurin-like phosphoesterase